MIKTARLVRNVKLLLSLMLHLADPLSTSSLCLLKILFLLLFLLFVELILLLFVQ